VAAPFNLPKLQKERPCIESLSCSEPPKLQRTVRCDQHVSRTDSCIAAENRCDLRSSHEHSLRLDCSPALESLLTGKTTLTAVSDS
jgi:hypothetical protein